MSRCSSGTDRRRQEWLENSCDSLELTQACPAQNNTAPVSERDHLSNTMNLNKYYGTVLNTNKSKSEEYWAEQEEITNATYLSNDRVEVIIESK